MLATFVPAAKTPLSFDEARDCMKVALARILQHDPEDRVLALALAKTALETGRWSAIWNANWGNVKASENYRGSFTCILLNEVLASGVTWFAPEGQLNRKGGEVISTPWDVPPGHPQTRMRAYSSPLEGAIEYVHFVADGRYTDAWKELLEGDAEGYVAALHRKGYFTADPAVYARGVSSLHREFLARLAKQPAPPPEESIERIGDAVRDIIATQEWNLRELRVLAQAAATESTFDLLDEGRRDALDQMMSDDDEEPK